MLQSLIKTPKKLALAALKPQRALAGLRYSLSGWLEETPESSLPKNIKDIVPRDAGFRQISFTFAVIALSAQVARSGGPLTQAKYIAFREAFPLEGQVCGKIRSLFTLACENTMPYTYYVAQIRQVFPGNQSLFSSLVARLFSIASADGKLPASAERMLSRIAHMLDIGSGDYAAICARYDGSARPHEVLGVKKRTSSAALKTRYRELMKNWHPDRFASGNVSPEVAMLLRLKASEINDAYRALAGKAA